jgi:hypothetical protein
MKMGFYIGSFLISINFTNTGVYIEYPSFLSRFLSLEFWREIIYFISDPFGFRKPEPENYACPCNEHIQAFMLIILYVCMCGVNVIGAPNGWYRILYIFILFLILNKYFNY